MFSGNWVKLSELQLNELRIQGHEFISLGIAPGIEIFTEPPSGKQDPVNVTGEPRNKTSGEVKSTRSRGGSK